MIFIWDNGEGYSDHSIEFIETDYEPIAEAEALIAAYKGWGGHYSDARILATSESLAWRDGGNSKLCEFISADAFFDYKAKPAIYKCGRDEYGKGYLLEHVTPGLLRYLIEGWKTLEYRSPKAEAALEALLKE